LGEPVASTEATTAFAASFATAPAAELQGDSTGVEAVRNWFEDALQHFAHRRIDCEIRDLGDKVLALGTLRTVGKKSGVETELPYAVVAKYRNGLMTHYIDYGDREKALDAVGLSKQDAHADS
jgi:ketosteroid isomerase-like protein